MKYVSPEYQQQLDNLASVLCPVAEEPEINSYAEIADIIIERPEVSQLGYTMIAGWDSEGRYITPC
jgi:hypothetical protein